MGTTKDLLNMQITYDIVVSDFGRDAAIEYLRLVATREKQLIEPILKRDGHEFFDEYRRMMFTVIGDLAFFKETAIAERARNDGFLTEDILIGLGPTPMSEHFADRVAVSVIQEALLAMDRGHERLRVMIPCNGLSIVSKRIEQVVGSVEHLRRLTETYTLRLDKLEKIATSHIKVHTVPETVLNYIKKFKKNTETTRLLVLGTPGVNSFYNAIMDTQSMEILPLEDWEYKLIDDAIVASIGGEQNAVDSCREQLRKRLIQPRSALFHDLVVLEACTDFRLGLGLNTLEVFAEAMVADCYQVEVA